MARDLKTPEYTRRAIARYEAKFDRVNVSLPKGAKAWLKKQFGDESTNKSMLRIFHEYATAHGWTPPEDGGTDSPEG